MKEYRVELKVRNNYLLRQMESRGIKNGAALAREAGIEPSEAGAFLNLAKTPFTTKGDMRAACRRICDCLGCDVEDIFPAEHINFPLEKYRASFELGVGEVELLTNQSDPERVMHNEEMRALLNGALSTLPNRVGRVLEMRFYEGMTLEDVGQELDVSRERVRQIEEKGLRMLRHPNRSSQLKHLQEA